MYAYVENSIIVDGPEDLPYSWRNVSNLPALSDAELLTLGWYPAVYDSIPAYDDMTQYVTGAWVVEATQVRYQYTLHNMTTQEKRARQTAFTASLNSVLTASIGQVQYLSNQKMNEFYGTNLLMNNLREQEIWNVKYAEAEGRTLRDAFFPILSSEASESGVSLSQFADAEWSKYQSFYTASSKIQTTANRAINIIKTSTTPEQAQNVVTNFTTFLTTI